MSLCVPMRRRQSGRSLVEILIVVVIMGVMAAMAGPSYHVMVARAEARSVAAEIAATLRSARQLAMARRERLLVRFDLPGRTVTLRRADAEGVLEVYRYGEKAVAVEEPTAGSDLLFHPSGRSASATTIRIQDRQGRRTTITVSLTGRVVIS
jgi:type IV fimbrial biogenesis protein FimT